MSREEAKRILEFDLDHTYNDESKEALRMAIKALEQKTDSEIISEESVKKILDELEKEFVKIDIPIMDKLTLFAKITNAIYKFAEQEPKTVLYSGDGYADGEMVYDMAECPSCGYSYEYGDKDWKEPYCPHCGQPLKWESEGEE